jgi:hypothetical protein
MTRDGHYVGITTARTVFTDPIIKPIATFRQQADTEEGYVIDMTQKTIDRVILSAGGSDVDGPVTGALSLSSDGSLVCFVSAADDLIFGDSNGVADAFVAHRVSTTTTPPPPGNNQKSNIFSVSTETGPSPNPLLVRASQHADGSLLLRVTVPGPGQVIAIAHRLNTGRSARSAGLGRLGRSSLGPVIARAVGSAHSTTTIRLQLRLLSRYGSLAASAAGVRAQITVTWSPPKPKVAKSTTVTAVFHREQSHNGRGGK